MNKITLSFLTASIVLTACNANAASCCGNSNTPNWYIGISGSAVFMQDIDLKGSIPGSGTEFESFKNGYGIGGEIGYNFYSNFRVELETYYRNNAVSLLNGSTQNIPADASNLRSFAVMSNLYYDFRNRTPVTPYIGGGVGGLDIKNPLYETLTINGATETEHFSQWLFGYQFMAGLSYEFPLAPIAVNLGYRYVGTSDGSTNFYLVPGYKVKFNADSQDIELGARVFF